MRAADPGRFSRRSAKGSAKGAWVAMFDSIYNAIAGNIDGLISGKYSAVVGMVSGPLHTAMAINLMVCGFAIMRGVSNEPWGAYLTTYFKAYMVIMAATSNFGPWAASLAQSLPDQLVGALGGTSIGGQFDTFIETVSAAAHGLATSAPKWNWDLGIASFETDDWGALFLYFCVVIATYISAAVAMVMALFIKFGLAVTIAVGPIFVGMLMFNSTSGLFFSWVGAVLNLAIQSAAIALAFVFVSGSVWSYAANAGAAGGDWLAIYSALIFQVAIVLVGAFLFLQASAIGSFAGGGGATGSPLVSAVLPSSRSLGRWARGGGRAIGGTRGALGSAGAAWGRARERAWNPAGITRLRGASSSKR